MNEINFMSYTTPGARPFTVTADYTVDHEVGSGGFGIVFSGTHRITNERVAIKQAFLDGRCAIQWREKVRHVNIC